MTLPFWKCPWQTVARRGRAFDAIGERRTYAPGDLGSHYKRFLTNRARLSANDIEKQLSSLARKQERKLHKTTRFAEYLALAQACRVSPARRL